MMSVASLFICIRCLFIDCIGTLLKGAIFAGIRSWLVILKERLSIAGFMGSKSKAE